MRSDRAMRRCAPAARAAPRASFATRSAARVAAPAPRSVSVAKGINQPRLAITSLRQASPFALPRRAYTQVTAEPDFRDYKRTTGLD